MRRGTGVGLGLAAAVLVWPGAADACSVCFDATEQNREAFIGTTVFLTALPLLLLGSGFLWLRARHAETAPPPRRW